MGVSLSKQEVNKHLLIFTIYATFGRQIDDLRQATTEYIVILSWMYPAVFVNSAVKFENYLQYSKDYYPDL